jgi:hypothetical protein
MCNAGYSSLWAKEVDTHPELKQFQKSFKRNNVADKILGDFDNLTKNLTKLSLTGGEPMLIKDHLTVLERLVAQGRTDVELTITTNLTALNPQWFDIIKQFKTVHWTVSIDEPGDYIRWPYNWDQVNQNLKQLLKLKHSVAINCTLTVYSLLTVDGLVDYFVKTSGRACGPFELWFSVAEFPPAISVNAIPKILLPRIVSNLSRSINTLKLIPNHENSVNVLTGVLTSLNDYQQNDEAVEKFWTYTQMLDQQRNQNFHTYYGETNEYRKT